MNECFNIAIGPRSMSALEINLPRVSDPDPAPRPMGNENSDELSDKFVEKRVRQRGS